MYVFDVPASTGRLEPVADGALGLKACGAGVFELSVMILGATDVPDCFGRGRPGVELADVELLTPVTTGSATAGPGVLDGVNDEEEDEEAASAWARGFGWEERGVGVAPVVRVTAITRRAGRK